MTSRSAFALALGCFTIITACGGGDDGGPTVQQTFTLSVAPTTLSVQAGGAQNSIVPEANGASLALAAAGTGTLNVTIARSGGFDGSVAVTVEGLPTGVTASALTIGGGLLTGSITITAAANAAVGTATLTVRGTGIGVSAQTATVQLTITAAPGFTLTVTPAAVSIEQGQSGTSTANIARVGGFTGAVALTSSGAPAGMTVTFTPPSATGATSAIAVAVGAAVATGPHAITVTGSSAGASNQTATLTVTVTAPVVPAISLSLAPATLSIQQGQSGTSTLTIGRTNFTGAVALTSSGAPTGATVSFNPTSATGTTSTITVDVPATVGTGTSTITITGTGTGITNATATLALTVTAPPASSIALAVAPTTLTIPAGGTAGTATVTLTRNNFTADVGLTSSVAPAGPTVAFSPATLSGSTLTSTATVTVGAAVAPGAYTVTITGAGTGVSNATTTLTVTVTAAAAIAISTSPTTLTVAQSASGTSTLTLVRTNFTADVALTSSVAPAGPTVAFSPATLSGSILTSTATVTVGAAVAPGAYTVTITGAGTGVTNATTTLTVTVTAAAAIVLTTNPATLSVQQGQSGTTTLTIARTNFTGAVALTSSGEPGGVTVSFSPQSTTGTTSTVTVAVGAAVGANTYTITLTGAGTGITSATVTLSLTVTASGGGGGNVALTFCQQTGLPLWVAFSNNGGPWTQVTAGANNTYSFTINPKGIVAYVLPASGGKTSLFVVYGTTAELNGRGTTQCVGNGTFKTINVTVNGVAANEVARIAMGGGGGSVVGGLTPNTFQMTTVQDGLRDLLGIKSPSFTDLSANSIVIQRDLNIANNGSVTVDFATGVAPVSRTSTIANLGSQVGTFNVNFITKNFSVGGLFFDLQPATTLTRTWTGVPDANTVAGDFHVQTVLAINNATTPLPMRAVSVYNRLATNQTLTLPNAIATLPTVTVAGTSPYVTINSNWVVEAAYNALWTLVFSPASGTVSSVVVTGSSAYFGSGPVTLNIPTFGAGFNAAHGMQPGILVNWTFTAFGGTLYSTGPAEGAIGNFATVGASFTP